MTSLLNIHFITYLKLIVYRYCHAFKCVSTCISKYIYIPMHIYNIYNIETLWFACFYSNDPAPRALFGWAGTRTTYKLGMSKAVTGITGGGACRGLKPTKPPPQTWWLVVEPTHLKNMLVKFGSCPQFLPIFGVKHSKKKLKPSARKYVFIAHYYFDTLDTFGVFFCVGFGIKSKRK